MHRRYHFALERLPNDSSVLDVEVGFACVGSDFAWGDVEDIHDTDDVVFSIATALHVIVELVAQPVVHSAAEKRGMDADVALEVLDEEHPAGTGACRGKTEARRGARVCPDGGRF